MLYSELAFDGFAFAHIAAREEHYRLRRLEEQGKRLATQAAARYWFAK
jgi:hypothetical protein